MKVRTIWVLLGLLAVDAAMFGYADYMKYRWDNTFTFWSYVSAAEFLIGVLLALAFLVVAITQATRRNGS